ncbi:hypothetical protein M436DRAFT_86037 [Aureobasidium namibiae CBS 147.97]|uniref:Mei2-like C-terminal RNA recognition motif domain-containing protein n=1 Tax=Aureobasidium namibiae CBS 147.97 TaxID=1043004 RepID=A0A074WBB7_9PEZI|nr:uncharacterized protein M436DRAFT_86037 [Aureobasidium namibiae CBS 147.97]KEQ68879.1 hypothetical protein M436DRAFT_86037 [Aureobasidium namibiae CBS 147.97]
MHHPRLASTEPPLYHLTDTLSDLGISRIFFIISKSDYQLSKAYGSMDFDPEFITSYAAGSARPVQQARNFLRSGQVCTNASQKTRAGIGVRTTIMLRNIPNRVDFEDMKQFLDETQEGHYDFPYLDNVHPSSLT